MSSEISTVVTIRPYKAEDRNFVLATFLRGLYYDNEFFGMIPKASFMENYKIVAEVLVSKANIRIACLREDPELIVGYSITDTKDEILHWVYTKAGSDPTLTWRKRGIMNLLLPKSLSTFTHFTSLGLKINDKLSKPLTFNPFKTI